MAPPVGRAARERAAKAKRWVCRFCLHQRTGEPWHNHADATSCFLCGGARGRVYKFDLAPPVPSHRTPPARGVGA
eukprot:8694073-Pyramimonas_sp.AAC.1